MTAPFPVTVDIEVWTRHLVTSGRAQTGYTLIYVDPKTQQTHRVATRETEFEARQFAGTHHWIVGRVFEDHP